MWGGFCVGRPTLSRFFALHFLLPFVIGAITFFHIFFLHIYGSSNPLGVSRLPDKIPFHWYYSSKDIFGFICVAVLMCFLVFFYPTLFMEADNFIPANPLVTPAHIIPE